MNSYKSVVLFIAVLIPLVLAFSINGFAQTSAYANDNGGRLSATPDANSYLDFIKDSQKMDDAYKKYLKNKPSNFMKKIPTKLS